MTWRMLAGLGAAAAALAAGAMLLRSGLPEPRAALAPPSELPLAPASPDPGATPPPTRPAASPWQAAAPSRAPAADLPLEALLAVPQVPQDGADPSHIELGPEAETPTTKSSSAQDRLRVTHREAELDPAAPKDASLRRTEVDVALPVEASETVRLRPGLRVEQRSDATREAETVEPTPTVGVEVRF